MTRLGIVINPTAGRDRGRIRGHEVVDLLTQRGHQLVNLSGSSIEQATEHARQAVVEGLDALVVVGGDGTVHLGANVVAGTSLPLGIVAAGSGNDLARGLGLPRHDIKRAVAAIEHGLAEGPRRIDAVQVGSPSQAVREWYVGALSAGLDAAINARANTMRWPRGSARYVRAVLAELRVFSPYGYRVTTDEGVWESPGTLVAAANGPLIGGGVRIAPDALFDDGLLDVVVAGPFTRSGAMRIFPGMYWGRHVRHPAIEVIRTRSVLIEPTRHGSPPPEAFADGERIGALPLHAEVHPGALHILV